MRISRARPSVLSLRRATSQRVLEDDWRRLERNSPRARRRSYRVSRGRSPFGSSKCTPCSAGKYAASERATECKSAEPGWSVAEDRASKQERRPRGPTRGGSGSEACTLCEAGKFAASPASPECTPARQGYIAAEEGAKSEKKCESGSTLLARDLRAVLTPTRGSTLLARPQRSKSRVLLDASRLRPRVLATCARRGEFSAEKGKASCTSCAFGSSSESEIRLVAPSVR